MNDNIVMVAHDPIKKLTLVVETEESFNTPSPRCDGTFGTLMCWNNHYNLSDDNDFEDPVEFLCHLARQFVDEETIINAALNGDQKGLKAKKNQNNIELSCLFMERNWIDQTYNLNNNNEKIDLIEEILTSMEQPVLLKMVQNSNKISMIPVYAYEHGGITISTTPFSCKWDSRCIGWIYATYDKIKESYGDIEPETIKKAEQVLEAEIEILNLHVQGSYYSYTLYSKDEQIDSCGGILAELSDLKNEIKPALSSWIYEYLADELTDDLSILDVPIHQVDKMTLILRELNKMNQNDE